MLLIICFVEPGFYQEGEFGIRIENVMLVKEAQTPHNFNNTTFLCFEPLTLVRFLFDWF
jgi:Xaa-Pro aminopeptidase